MRFFLRILINAAALAVAVRVVPGIRFTGGLINLVLVALVFGVLNAVVRPILILLSLPLLILTLGLFTLVLNAVVLYLTSALSSDFGLGLAVSGFGAAFWGAIVVSIVSILLSMFVRESLEPKR